MARSAAFRRPSARDGRIAASTQEVGNVALERGLVALQSVLDEAGLRSESIDRLAVGVGPGGFTGLRIAVTYAKSLAVAWERPLVALSSFDLLEFGRSFERVLTVVVGRPGVISARYRQGKRTRRASGRTADVLGELAAASSPLTTLGPSTALGMTRRLGMTCGLP